MLLLLYPNNLKLALCLHLQYLSLPSVEFLFGFFFFKLKLVLNFWHLQTYHFKKGALKVISRPKFEFSAQNKMQFLHFNENQPNGQSNMQHMSSQLVGVMHLLLFAD